MTFRQRVAPVCDRPRRLAPVFFALGITLVLSACHFNRGGDDGSADMAGGTDAGNSSPSDADTTAPSVVTITPGSGTSGLDPSITVTVTFSEPIDPSSIDGTRFTLVGPYGPISGMLTVNGTGVTLTPDHPLPTNTTITATITGVRDVAGNSLGAAYQWSFSTRSFTPSIGTSATDEAYGVAVDSNSHIYIAGYTDGAFDSHSNTGLSDILLIKYDAAGNALWSRQLGGTHQDRAKAVATDGADNVVLAGYTKTALGGNTHAGLADTALVKYDANGTLQWIRQLGTAAWDEAAGITTDGSDNIIVVGQTDGDLAGAGNAGGTDAFILKYDAAGTLLWSRQHGSAQEDIATGAVVDSSGNIYVTGFSRGDLDGQLNVNVGWADLFLIKYDAAGNHQWTHLFGTIVTDKGAAIALDSAGDIYIAGATVDHLNGIPNAGGFDVFVVKYDTAGSRLWTRQFGSNADDFAYGLTADDSGHVYVTGSTLGNLDGHTNSGAEDLFIAKYDSSGNRIWTQVLGTTGSDVARGIAKDEAAPFLYVTGRTSGALDGQPNMGGHDLFALKYDIDGHKR